MEGPDPEIVREEVNRALAKMKSDGACSLRNNLRDYERQWGLVTSEGNLVSRENSKGLVER